MESHLKDLAQGTAQGTATPPRLFFSSGIKLAPCYVLWALGGRFRPRFPPTRGQGEDHRWSMPCGRAQGDLDAAMSPGRKRLLRDLGRVRLGAPGGQGQRRLPWEGDLPTG